MFRDARENPLIGEARAAKRLTRPIVTALMCGFVVVLAVTFGGLLTSRLIFPEGVAATERPLLAVSVLLVQFSFAFGTIWLFLWLWVTRFERRPFLTLFGPRSVDMGPQILRGAAVGAALCAGTVLVLAGTGSVAFEGDEGGWTGLTAIFGILLVLPGYAVQASAEEALCRGWLLQTAGLRYGIPIAATISSLVFAGYHIALDPDVGGMGVLNLFLFGIFLCLYAAREGSLWGVCGLHTAYNITEANVFGFDSYGEEAAGGVIVNLTQAGSELLTGGGVGLNTTGGLGFTIVLVVALAGITVLGRWSKSGR